MRKLTLSTRVAMARATAAMPPTKGAPQANFPIGIDRDSRPLAPAPLADRFPLVVGQSLSIAYLSQVLRLCTVGYRLQFVDLLNELLEHDPHLFSVVQKRILATANGRIEIVSAITDPTHKDFDRAAKVAELVQSEIDRIPNRTQVLAALLWGIYYGLSAAEIFWSREGAKWHVDRLDFVHSRRLSYPDSQSWQLHIWDQGQVFGWDSPFGSSPTNATVYGLRISDYPGKFIVFAPQLRGDYPTRDGLGRQCATWAVFKRVGVRGAVDYLERFSKPFMDVVYNTATSLGDGPAVPRVATQADIDLAETLAQSVGPGGNSSAFHADSIKLDPKTYDGTGTSRLTWSEWVGLCNAEESKAVLGSTLGTEVGHGGGNRALGEVMERGETELSQYDASCLGEAFKRDLVTWIVRLNSPNDLDVIPDVDIHVETDPDPKAILENAKTLTSIGGPVDLDKLSDEVGIPLVDAPESTDAATGKKSKKKQRGSFMSDVVDPTIVDPNLMSDEAKQAAQDDKDAQNAIAMTKAKQPVAGPPGVNGPPAKAKPGAKPAKAAADKKKARKGAAYAKRVGATDDDDAVVTMTDEENDELLVLLRSSKHQSPADPEITEDVYEQLREDFPRKAVSWVKAATWVGPVKVPVADIDDSSEAEWHASKESEAPRVEGFAKKVRDGEDVKPVVLVSEPDNPKFVIVDGHHRYLAHKRSNAPTLLAYVAKVGTADGAWSETHSQQLGQQSR